MPTRGYRKGLKDNKVPLPRQIYTRASDALHQVLESEANSRGICVSTLARKVLEAHANNTPTELPHKRGLTSAAVHQLARIGNNLNQLARQANAGLVAVSAREIEASLSAVNDLVRSL